MLFLAVCLFNMPYGYYEFVRFISMIGFGILAYDSYKKGYSSLIVIYIVLAVLFQPIIKIALGRFIWVIVDIVVALFLAFMLNPKYEKRINMLFK